MKKLILLALILSFPFLNGCITIIEKYTINKNGSGTMEYIIDMSEMYEMMSTFSDSTGEIDNTDLNQSMRVSLPELQGIEGITNAELTGDNARYIAGIKFNFKDVESLNQALAVLFKKDDNTSGSTKYVDINKKTFTRFSLTSDEFNKEEILGSEELDPETMKSVLESMKYKIIVNFEKPVKKVTTLSPFTRETNTVSIETNFSDIFDNSELLQTTIKTK